MKKIIKRIRENDWQPIGVSGNNPILNIVQYLVMISDSTQW